MRIGPVLIIICLAFNSCSNAEKKYFSVVAEERSYIDCLVRIDLEALYGSDVPENPGLFLEQEKVVEQIAYQADLTMPGYTVIFMIEGKLDKGDSRSYFFQETGKRGVEQETPALIQQDEDKLVILNNESEVLTYHISETMPPPGIDSLYRRSAYIHPLVSPGGEVLTRVQPPDHYHHYGIWNPWTLTHINGREIDYWNLAKGEGTVRAKAILDAFEGPVQATFTTLQEHVDFGYEGGERVTMEEFWEVCCTPAGPNGQRYLLDMKTTFRNVLRDTILFDAYRYGGGLGYRATGKWNEENSTVLTSEGIERAGADGTRARWCIVEGVSDTEEGRSGILFLSHPDNREHPEPMRVWPAEINNGELFFEFCPIRQREWLILPGVDNVLQYRMIVFDGSMTAEEAEMYWNSFVNGPEVSLQPSAVRE